MVSAVYLLIDNLLLCCSVVVHNHEVGGSSPPPVTKFMDFNKCVERYVIERLKILKGVYNRGDPPLPIPNREVKPLSADGTAWWWESRLAPNSEALWVITGLFYVTYFFWLFPTVTHSSLLLPTLIHSYLLLSTLLCFYPLFFFLDCLSTSFHFLRISFFRSYEIFMDTRTSIGWVCKGLEWFLYTSWAAAMRSDRIVSGWNILFYTTLSGADCSEGNYRFAGTGIFDMFHVRLGTFGIR